MFLYIEYSAVDDVHRRYMWWIMVQIGDFDIKSKVKHPELYFHIFRTKRNGIKKNEERKTDNCVM